MADYFNLKNDSILNPPPNTNLGNATNQFGNVYVANTLSVGNTTVTGTSIVTPKISSIGYPGDDTAANPAGGQTITLTGSGFNAGASVIVNGNAVGVVSVVNSQTITFVSPAISAGGYTIYVVNSDGGTAIAIPGIQYSGVPTWSTAAGSLGSQYEITSISQTFTATGDNPVTYSLYSGTLPPGASLNSSTGALTGTTQSTASSTTYNFTIRATDAQNQDTDRSFSLTVDPDVVTWSSPTDNQVFTGNTTSALSTVTLSATSAAGRSITYSANALPTGLSLSSNTITGNPTVVANTAVLLTATASTTNRFATKLIYFNISQGSTGYRYGIFGYGYSTSNTAITNLVGNTGTVATDTAGVGTGRQWLAATSYGGDKGIFGYGLSATAYQSVTNKVSNTGVVATDTTGVGTTRGQLSASTYGTDKGIFAFGSTGSDALSIYNLISNTGVAASDQSSVATRNFAAGCGYSTDKGIFAYGRNNNGLTSYNTSNLLSNTGVIASDTAGVGSPRYGLAATTYGGDKGIFAYGYKYSGADFYYSLSNLVSNTGVVATDGANVGTGRYLLAATPYGSDKGIFGYGSNASGNLSMTNKVSNTGVVATDTTGVGSSRAGLAGCGYGN